MEVLTVGLLSLIVIVISTILWKQLRKPKLDGPHPFQPITNRGQTTAERYVYEWKARKKLLRQPFQADAAKDGGPYDAIVIGSGMGGLTPAVLMAKMGKKVLVLEQNAQLGGCTHTFNHKGYEFDVGIHYIGHMNPGHPDRYVIDQLTEGQLEWEEMDKNFDTVVLGGSGVEGEATFIPIGKSLRDSEMAIAKEFPDEKTAIHEFFEMVKKKSNEFSHFVIVKFIPVWLVSLLGSLGIIRLLSSFYRTNSQNLADYLEKLTSNKALRTTLAYCFGDYGTFPKQASVHLHAGLWSHFAKGGFYPVGGASEITLTMMNIIKKAGGRIFGKAKVSEIICDDLGRAIGVRVVLKPDKPKGAAAGDAAPSGPKSADLFAPIIVSAAGVVNTSTMLPASVKQKTCLPGLVKGVGPGVGGLSVFIGLRNSAEQLGLTARNWWAFPHGRTMDIDEAIAKFEAFESLGDFLDSNQPFPLFFASFPSKKDPLWEGRNPGKAMSTLTIVTLAPWAWFESWKSTKHKKRGDDYEAVKRQMGMKLWEQVCSIMPKSFEEVAEIEMMDVGTPVTNNHYLGSTQGEIYGLDHGISRFGLEHSAALRPNIGVENLYLSGQDVMTCGMVGAMMGGVMCASEITGRNLLIDAYKMAREARGGQEAKKGMNGASNGASVSN